MGCRASMRRGTGRPAVRGNTNLLTGALVNYVLTSQRHFRLQLLRILNTVC